MADNQNPPSPQEELKDKLKQTRTTFTHAKKLLREVEVSHTRFIKLRNALADKDNGVEANIKWVQEQKREIRGVAKEASDKLAELEGTAKDVQNSIDDIKDKYKKFKTVSAGVFDQKNGLKAILATAKRLKKSIDKLSKQVEGNAETANSKLTEINNTSNEVATAYKEFLDKKAEIDNEETGFEAQLRRATEYADNVQSAKTKAESAYVSVTKFKEESDELVEAIKGSKGAVDEYQKESEELTSDIKNTLNKASAFTLSQALQDRTKKLTKQMRVWGFFQFLAVAALICAVGLIFYGLFFHGTSGTTDITDRLQDGPTLMSVASKILFTTPLVFAVFFTTSNYNRTQELRDRYAWKETVAKNFQNYIKLMQDEFDDPKYQEERFKFSMETIRSIYSEPNPSPKKRKINIGYNKILQLAYEEEDIAVLKKIVDEYEKNGKKEQPNKKIKQESNKKSGRGKTKANENPKTDEE